MDLLLEFRRFEVERRRFSPLGEAKWQVRKETRERQGKVTTRAAKSNGWKDGEMERRACEEGSREEELASANAGSQFVTVRRLG